MRSVIPVCWIFKLVLFIYNWFVSDMGLFKCYHMTLSFHRAEETDGRSNGAGQGARLPLMVWKLNSLLLFSWRLQWFRHTPIKGGVYFKFILHRRGRSNLSFWETTQQTVLQRSIFFWEANCRSPPSSRLLVLILPSEKIAFSDRHVQPAHPSGIEPLTCIAGTWLLDVYLCGGGGVLFGHLDFH